MTHFRCNRPLVLCLALCAGGYALAQDAGFQVPPPAATRVVNPPAAKSRTHGMTVEQSAAAIESVRAQRAELDKWSAS
jgi:hypothetical protein